MKKNTSVKRITFLGLLLAAGLALAWMETLIPISLGVPGVKLGLANVVTLMALYTLGASQAFLLGVLRILLTGFSFGGIFAMLYSFCGFFLSFAGMWALKRSRCFGMMGVSGAGGILHNMGQLICAALVLRSPYVFTLFPVLLLAGTLAGAVTGILGGMVTKRLYGSIMETIR